MKLSLCIATFNEEQNIHYPLDSVYDMVDEVVIVDGGSTDKTVEKAKSYGKKVKVYREDNPPIFHINKQKAIDRAAGEWILQLDADEALSNELKKEIHSLVILNEVKDLVPTSSGRENNYASLDSSSDVRRTQNDKAVAYWIPRKNFFLTRFLMKGGQYPDYTIRLYRNGYAKFPCKTVHENVEIITNSEFRVQSSESKSKNEKILNSKFNSELLIPNSRLIGFLKNPILHYADPDFSRFLKRWDRYTSSEADLLFQQKKQIGFVDYFFIKPLVWFLLAYFRHRGYVDGFPGFVFALFSSIRFWAIYTKMWSIAKIKSTK